MLASQYDPSSQSIMHALLNNPQKTIAVLILVILLSSIASEGKEPVKSGRSSERGGLVTTGLDAADFQAAAAELVKSLLESKAFAEQVEGRKPLIARSQFFNKTPNRHINLSAFTDTVRASIVKDGRAEISQNLGIIADGSVAVIDAVGLDVDDLKRMRAGDRGIRIPDLTLSGKILSAQTKSGKSKEFLYNFQMVLAKGNIVVWQDQVEIRKVTQDSRSK
jgi:PBP1b-binding outer membrane lipoprotein LpoB